MPTFPANPLQSDPIMSETNLTLPQVDLDFMNEDHAHAVEAWRNMATALAGYPEQREPLLAACRAFLEHNREHFAREEAAMQQHAFPPYRVHKADHDRTLVVLEALTASVEAGQDREDVEKAIGRDIPAWLQQHVQSMDMVTARFLAPKIAAAKSAD